MEIKLKSKEDYVFLLITLLHAAGECLCAEISDRATPKDIKYVNILMQNLFSDRTSASVNPNNDYSKTSADHQIIWVNPTYSQ